MYLSCGSTCFALLISYNIRHYQLKFNTRYENLLHLPLVSKTSIIIMASMFEIFFPPSKSLQQSFNNLITKENKKLKINVSNVFTKIIILK